MPSDPQADTHLLESYLPTLEAIFEQSLAHFKSDPKEETYRALKDAQTRLMVYRIGAGQPISDLLPRMKQVLDQVKIKRPE